MASLGQEGLGICAEDTGRCCSAGWNCPDTMAFDLIYGADVVCVHNAGCTECAEDLREEVDGKAFPGKFAEEAEAECHSGIEEAA